TGRREGERFGGARRSPQKRRAIGRRIPAVRPTGRRHHRLPVDRVFEHATAKSRFEWETRAGLQFSSEGVAEPYEVNADPSTVAGISEVFPSWLSIDVGRW